MALEAIDWKYYLIFVALNLFYGAFWFVFGVETRGRTLEQLHAVFEAKWPPTASLEKTTVIKGADGRVEAFTSEVTYD